MNKKLYNRVCDIYCGALGHQYREDHDFLGAEELARVITALQSEFDPNGKHDIFFSKWNIANYDNPKEATRVIEMVLRAVESDKAMEKVKA